MIKLNLICALMFFLISCSYSSKYVFINEFNKNIKQSHDIKFFTESIWSSLNNEKNFDLFFTSYQIVNLEEARFLLVESVEQFRLQLNNINLNNSIELEGAQTSLGFSIAFIKPNGGFIDDPYIAQVFLSNDMVNYAMYNFNSDSLNNFFSEPYQKAKEIVDQHKSLKNLEDNNEVGNSSKKSCS